MATNNAKTKTISTYTANSSAKRDHRKTSVPYTVLAVILYALAIVPIIVVPCVLAIRAYNMMPYYSFWPFVGVILAGVFVLIFSLVTLIVSRKRTKSSIRTQTVKIAITYVCITSVFGAVLTYVFPDVIGFATQSTLFCEEMYYNSSKQLEINAKLDRDFIMYNLLIGNLNTYDENGLIAEDGDFSYATLSKRIEDNGTLLRYENDEINDAYMAYMDYESVTAVESQFINPMKKNERKYELYEFIYTKYVLTDYDYAFDNSIKRRAFALALIDYIYSHCDYEGLLKDGFGFTTNENGDKVPNRVEYLRQNNFASMDQDGYSTFDDPLLLFAQRGGRMTVPVVLRLILNEGWTVTQSSWTSTGEPVYNELGSHLYQIYDPAARDEFEANGGVYDHVGQLVDLDGHTVDVNYGYNDKGWKVFENGVVRRPMDWLVLDMDGNAMHVFDADVSSIIVAGMPIMELVQQVLDKLPMITDALGNLVADELINQVVVEATGGAKLNLALYITDDNRISLDLLPMNHYYGVLGYQNISWMNSNNLLMAVINIIGLRNWLYIFGGVGVVVVIGAGILRECGKRTRERTDRARASIKRSARGETTLTEYDMPKKTNKNAKSGAKPNGSKSSGNTKSNGTKNSSASGKKPTSNGNKVAPQKAKSSTNKR